MLALEDATEAHEGSLVQVTGTVASAPDVLADGFAVSLEDPPGVLRMVVASATGIAPTALPRGARVTVTGVLGQRATSDPLAGYRLYPRSTTDLVVAPVPTPTPTPTPTATATPVPTGTPPPTASPVATAAPSVTPAPTAPSITPSPTPAPTPTPSPTASAPVRVTIATARARPVRSVVRIRGTVTLEPGRLGDPAAFVLEDPSGGLLVVPRGITTPGMRRGDQVEVEGEIRERYRNRELRVTAAPAIRVVATGSPLVPRPYPLAAIGEPGEGRLVAVRGRVTRVTARAAGGLLVTLTDGGHDLRVETVAATGWDRERLVRGAVVRVVGVVAQRTTSTRPSEGYRLWPRDASDLAVLVPARTPRPTASPPPSPTHRPTRHPVSPLPTLALPTLRTPRDGVSPQPRLSSIRTAFGIDGEVTVQGVVVTEAGLLDAQRRRIVIQDVTGALLVRLPVEGPRPASGDRIRLTGDIGPYQGSRQLAANDGYRRVGSGSVAVRRLLAPARQSDAWQLASVSGTVVSIRRSGQGWRAELRLPSGALVPIHGLPGSGIPVAALEKERAATVVGVLRPPTTSARDRRVAIVPRRRADIAVGPAGPDPSEDAATHAPGDDPGSGGGDPDEDDDAGPAAPASWGASGAGSGPGAPSSTAAGTPAGDAAVPDVDVLELPRFLGQRVRAGGLVVAVAREQVRFDDGSGEAVAFLGFEADGVLDGLRPDDAINVTGRVAAGPDGEWRLVVTEPADLVRVGALGEPLRSVEPGGPATSPSAVTGSGDADPAGASGSDPALPAGGGSGLILFVLAALFLPSVLGLGAWAVWRAWLRVRPSGADTTGASTPAGDSRRRAAPAGSGSGSTVAVPRYQAVPQQPPGAAAGASSTLPPA